MTLEEADDLDVVVVNPSSVQGPGRATGTGRILLSAVKGRMPFAVKTTVSVVDVDDCARGHILAAERGTAGERYLMSGASFGIEEGLALVSQVAGVELAPRYVPASLVVPIAALVEGTARLARRRAPMCREMARVLAHGHAYDGSKATRRLGLAYQPITDTLSRAVEWFRSKGLVNGRR